MRPEEEAAVELGLDIGRRETRGPHAKGPQRMAVLLRLDAPKHADNLCRCRWRVAGQPLGRQAAAKHLAPDVGWACRGPARTPVDELERHEACGLSHDVGTLADVCDRVRSAFHEPEFRLTARLCRFRHARTFSRLNSPGQVPPRREDAPLYASNPDSVT